MIAPCSWVLFLLRLIFSQPAAVKHRDDEDVIIFLRKLFEHVLQVILVAIAFIYLVEDGLSHGMAIVHDSVAGIINVDQQFDFAFTVMGSNSSD